MTFAYSSPVMPDLIRHPASSCATAEGSGTPDQVRGDDMFDVARGPLAMSLKGSMPIAFMFAATVFSVPSAMATEMSCDDLRTAERASIRCGGDIYRQAAEPFGGIHSQKELDMRVADACREPRKALRHTRSTFFRQHRAALRQWGLATWKRDLSYRTVDWGLIEFGTRSFCNAIQTAPQEALGFRGQEF